MLSNASKISANEIPANDKDVLEAVGSLRELLDLSSVARIKPWRTYQVSSGLMEAWRDYGNFVREEPGGRYVLMDVTGAGCIDRFWCVYKKGRPEEVDFDLLVYLDNQEEPAIHMDLNDFFDGKRVPFVEPLAGRCGQAHRPSSFSLVPIGFQKSCKIVVQKKGDDETYDWRIWPGNQKFLVFFYHLTFRLFPAGTPVKRFTWELDKEERDALDKVRTMWRNAGASPWNQHDKNKNHSTQVVLGDDKRAVLLDEKGAGSLREIYIHIKPGDDSPEARKRMSESLMLEITWDDAERPQISVPVGVFFAAPDSHIDMRGLWLGCAKREYYCYLPMPFHRRARISLVLTEPVDQPIAVNARFAWSTEPPSAEDGLFHAHRYDYDPPTPGENYVIIDTEGTGHAIGITMDRPGYQEGDDAWFVDGETTPSIMGTGTEDIFTFAWGLADYQSLALHGMRMPFAQLSPQSVTAYRIHLPAAVPFQKSLLVTCEHGCFLDSGMDDQQIQYSGRTIRNMDQQRYSGVLYYYLLPKTEDQRSE